METEDRLLTNAEIAQAMRRTFGTDGDNWGKGSYENDGRYCLVGAWMLIERIDANSYRTLSRIIREQFPERIASDVQHDDGVIVTFNDHKDTIFADIRAILEKLETSE